MGGPASGRVSASGSGSASGRVSASESGSASRGVCMQGVGRPPYWMLRDTVNERAVHILLECILVSRKK